ncbi:MAG: phosphoribosyltransferase [Phycisphaerae bacterium]
MPNRRFFEERHMHHGESSSTSGPPTAPGRVVVDRSDIARRVGELADEIASHYGSSELTILAVLTGSLIFLADLIRRMPVMMRLDLVSVSSYPGRTTVSHGPRVTTPWAADVRNRHVLIVDDILDSGQTLQMIRKGVTDAGARDVRACVLLRKTRDDLPDRGEAEFVGFDVPNEFLIGYGLDHDGLYRNLPDIRCLGETGRTAP